MSGKPALILMVAGWLWCADLQAAPWDWAEGSGGAADGATRDYYNGAGRLAWRHKLGDWRDADGTPQGDTPFAVATLADDDRERTVTWDVTDLVRQWVRKGEAGRGLMLRVTGGRGSFHFRSREYAKPDQRPRLALTRAGRTANLAPSADTFLEPSTYRCLGTRDQLRVSPGRNRILMRFDLSSVKPDERIDKAVLQLHTFAQYGGGKAQVGVFECDQGDRSPAAKPEAGLAARYTGDRGIEKDPDVLLVCRFESGDWAKAWSFARGKLDLLAADTPGAFQPISGKAVRVLVAKGANAAMNVGYKFRDKGRAEPEDIYFRYYLRLAADWNPTIEGGKMPGPSGTYGVAGWGGRKSTGANGWSARGAFGRTIPAGNPLAGRHPIGTYCYHAEQKGIYGNVWYWSEGYRGFLANNRWYCVEQYLRLNAPDKADGVLRAWVDGRGAFEKTDIRFRTVGKLKIEQIWMNVYHGGKRPSPRDMHLYIDNVVVARKYIGPMGGKER